MIVPNPSFRPNPDRCIHIDGRIDDQLISRVTPVILKLQQKSREPITVYILNSPGGAVSLMETILHLLKSPNQDFLPLCRVITVVTKRAGSAAADLLCSGDYAIAYPNSTILYHGSRVYEESALTKERTTLLADYLRWSTDYYAWDLAKRIENRFMFLFLILRDKFAEVRQKYAPKRMTDFECFLEIVLSKLSTRARTVCEQARDRYKRYEALLGKVTPKGGRKGKRRVALSEAKQIRAILDFELDANKKNRRWTFRYGGLGRLSEDFYLLTEYMEGAQSDRLKEWCENLGKFALSPAEKVEIDQITDEKLRNQKIINAVKPILQPVWSFFVALCHALQEGENELTATDAYWLGLIDEIMGDKDLCALRLLGEYKSDPPQPNPQDATDKKDGSEKAKSGQEKTGDKGA